jgi:CRISPR-associated endoribonuclease Cas6
MSFLRIALRFSINEPISFQSFSGYSIRGLLYKMIKEIDEEYASYLHDSKSLAPFSVSPPFIENLNSIYINYDKLNPGLYTINITLLQSKLIDIMIKYIHEKIGSSKIEIGGKEVLLNSLSLENISFENIYEKSNEIKSFKINFLTPTYFRLTPRDISKKYKYSINKKEKISAYRFYPLPDPVLLFRSIARIWRKFSNFNLNLKDFMEWIEIGGIAISGFPKGIKTHIVYEHPTTKKWCVGFTGIVHYSIVKDLYNSEKSKIANTLLKFATYTNVGGGRTAGLGMIKYEIEE